jgi:hypothetical protein
MRLSKAHFLFQLEVISKTPCHSEGAFFSDRRVSLLTAKNEILRRYAAQDDIFEMISNHLQA